MNYYFYLGIKGKNEAKGGSLKVTLLKINWSKLKSLGLSSMTNVKLGSHWINNVWPWV